LKARKLVLQAVVMGFSANIATIKIGNPAKERALSDYTDLLCPQDKKKPHYETSHYRCDCGFSTTTWQGLARVLKGTTTPFEMPTLTKGNGEVEIAKIFKMTLAAFAKISDYVDAKDAEHPVTAEDEGSIVNLYKLIVAQTETGHVIILKWNDTKEEIIALLTTTLSGKIVVRKIIPPNLVIVGESLMLDQSKMTKQDIEEAKLFLKQIPDATDEVLTVTDYRMKQFEVHQPEESKVTAIGAIMEKARARKEIVDKTTKREIIVQTQTKKKPKK